MTWRHVARKPSRLFFNHGRRAIFSLAVDRSSVLDESAAGDVPLPQSMAPDPKRWSGDLFLTEAPLKKVTAITLHQREPGIVWWIAGMVFRYSDERRCGVGSVRMDCASTTINVGPTDTLCLGFAWVAKTQVILSKVEVGRPRADRDLGLDWLDLSQDGVLTWWFNSSENVLYHNGRVVPLRRIDTAKVRFFPGLRS